MGVERGGIKDACQVAVGFLCVVFLSRFSLSVCRRGFQAELELIQGSETSANYNLTPGKYPEENIQFIFLFLYLFVYLLLI